MRCYQVLEGGCGRPYANKYIFNYIKKLYCGMFSLIVVNKLVYLTRAIYVDICNVQQH